MTTSHDSVCLQMNLDDPFHLPYMLVWMVSRNLKKIQGAKTRAELIAAGIEVFAERGYHGATMEDIAAAARTTRGALYWHFEDKEDFLVALLEGIIKRRAREKIDETPLEGSALELLVTSFIGYADANFRMPWFNRLIILVGLDAENIGPRIRNLMRQALAPNRYFLARYIRYGQQTGEFREDIDADQAGEVLAIFRVGLVASWYMDPDAFDVRRTARAFIQTLIPGLLTPQMRDRKISLKHFSAEELDADNAELMRGYIEAGAEARASRVRKRRQRAKRPTPATWKENVKGPRPLRLVAAGTSRTNGESQR